MRYVPPHPKTIWWEKHLKNTPFSKTVSYVLILIVANVLSATKVPIETSEARRQNNRI